jgi:hypothetical protein
MGLRHLSVAALWVALSTTGVASVAIAPAPASVEASDNVAPAGRQLLYSNAEGARAVVGDDVASGGGGAAFLAQSAFVNGAASVFGQRLAKVEELAGDERTALAAQQQALRAIVAQQAVLSAEVQNATLQHPPATGIEDFPGAPPTELGFGSDQNPTLGNSARSNSVVRLRLQYERTPEGPAVDIVTPEGQYVYNARREDYALGLSFEYWAFYAGNSTQRLATVIEQDSVFKDGMRYVYEVSAYSPICWGQQSDGRDHHGQPLYPFARLTMWAYTFYNYWSVDVYNCDDTDDNMERLWFVRRRYWFFYTSSYDTYSFNGTSGFPIATLDYADESYSRDLFIGVGVDQVLAAIVSTILHHFDVVFDLHDFR